MKRADAKAEIQSSLGSMLTNLTERTYSRREDFGNFFCAVEDFGDFSISQRRFETYGDSLQIPFTLNEPCVQMLFSFDGQSFFRNRLDPLTLGKSSHSINFFQGYDCANLLSDRARQHDITLRLRSAFYSDFFTRNPFGTDTGLAKLIARGSEFNTINEHLPLDAGLAGLLQGIHQCPFEGDMKKAFLKEHVRAIFMLQLFHFDSVATGHPASVDRRISKSDRDKLHEVKSFIDHHFLEPASLDSLCKDFGLNEFKLKSGFKALFETSPIRYMQQKRLTFALALLRDTDKPIKEISREIGYSHAANFTAAFARMFGNAPGSFRSE